VDGRGAGLAGRRRVITDPALRSVSHPNVYVIGDAASISQGYGVLHGTCQSGIPSAVHAAAGIARELKGKPPKPFRFGYVHQPVSVGRRDAVIQFTHPDDTPSRFYLSGRVAVAYKEAVSGSPWSSFRLFKSIPRLGTVSWRRGGRRTR
jgi:NADH:ubiquinone reductase (H+-translocating)